MPTNDQPNNPSESEFLDSANAESESVSILDEEGEAAPEQESSATANASSSVPISNDSYQAGDGLAPFEGAEHDPGLEDLELGEGDEAPEEPEPIVYRALGPEELQAAVEATIFMQQKPITIPRLRELINPGIDEEEYRTAISNLMAVFFDEVRGIELVEVANGFQFRTKSEHKDIIRRMYQIAPVKLTNAMLEVLAIVVYNQPLTREGVDKIRGVDSSHLLRVLLDKKMLRIAGKSDSVGNPMIYATTKEFLELFGLRDLSALPSLRELEEMLPKNEVGSISEEESLASEMEGIVAASKPVEFNDLEIEDWEDETPKTPEDDARSAAIANSDGRKTIDLSPQTGTETEGDVDLPPEIARRITPGQEGNA